MREERLEKFSECQKSLGVRSTQGRARRGAHAGARTQGRACMHAGTHPSLLEAYLGRKRGRGRLALDEYEGLQRGLGERLASVA